MQILTFPQTKALKTAMIFDALVPNGVWISYGDIKRYGRTKALVAFVLLVTIQAGTDALATAGETHSF